MVNGFRYYRALESVSIASALSTALTIYPCQIRVHQRWQSKLRLPTARKKEWRPATTGSSPQAVTCQHCDTHYFSRPRTRNLPMVDICLCDWLCICVISSAATFRSLVRRATSSATEPTVGRAWRIPENKDCRLPSCGADDIAVWVWDIYRRSICRLDQFHLRCLPKIARVKWQDRIPNTDVLKTCGIMGIEAFLLKVQLRWVGHIMHMPDSRIPKQVFLGQLASGKRLQCGPVL